MRATTGIAGTVTVGPEVGGITSESSCTLLRHIPPLLLLLREPSTRMPGRETERRMLICVRMETGVDSMLLFLKEGYTVAMEDMALDLDMREEDITVKR